MTVAVLGPGGVGGFLAAMLAHYGTPVFVLANDPTASALAHDGLRLESGRFGNFDVSVRTAARLAEPVDAVLITVKSTHLARAVERVPAGALGDAIVVPFLNGLDHVDFLRSIYPPARVVAATIAIETTRVETGLVRHTSAFAAIDIDEAGHQLADQLGATGIDVRIRDDEHAMLWDKFAVLAPIALLTTHERANVGVVRTKRRDDAVALIGEVAAVAKADGVTVDPSAVLNRLDSAHDSLESSMQRDQAAGRPLELDALGGALLRRAGRHNVPVPVAQRLVSELEAPTGQAVVR